MAYASFRSAPVARRAIVPRTPPRSRIPLAGPSRLGALPSTSLLRSLVVKTATQTQQAKIAATPAPILPGGGLLKPIGLQPNIHMAPATPKTAMVGPSTVAASSTVPVSNGVQAAARRNLLQTLASTRQMTTAAARATPVVAPVGPSLATGNPTVALTNQGKHGAGTIVISGRDPAIVVRAMDKVGIARAMATAKKTGQAVHIVGKGDPLGKVGPWIAGAAILAPLAVAAAPVIAKGAAAVGATAGAKKAKQAANIAKKIDALPAPQIQVTPGQEPQLPQQPVIYGPGGGPAFNPLPTPQEPSPVSTGSALLPIAAAAAALYFLG